MKALITANYTHTEIKAQPKLQGGANKAEKKGEENADFVATESLIENESSFVN